MGLFKSITIGGSTYTPTSPIVISEGTAVDIYNYLNSLNLGVFTVTVVVDQMTITSDNNSNTIEEMLVNYGEDEVILFTQSSCITFRTIPPPEDVNNYKCCYVSKVNDLVISSRKGCLNPCDVYSLSIFSGLLNTYFSYAYPRKAIINIPNPNTAFNQNVGVDFSIDGDLVISLPDVLYATQQDLIDALAVAINNLPDYIATQPSDGVIVITTNLASNICILQIVKVGTPFGDPFIFLFSVDTASDSDSNCISIDQFNEVNQKIKKECGCCGSDALTPQTSVTPNTGLNTIYFGNVTANPVTSGDVTALGSVTQSSFVGTYSYDATAPSEYKVIAYPAILGTPTRFYDVDTNFDIPMQAVYQIVVNSIAYNVYVTYNALGGAINIGVLS